MFGVSRGQWDVASQSMTSKGLAKSDDSKCAGSIVVESPEYPNSYHLLLKDVQRKGVFLDIGYFMEGVLSPP